MDRRRPKSVSAIKVKFDNNNLLISDKFQAQLENNFNSLKMKGIDDYQTAEKPAKTLSPQARSRHNNGRSSQHNPVKRSGFTLEHNSEMQDNRKLATNGHREGSNVGCRKQRNPLIRDIFKSQLDF